MQLLWLGCFIALFNGKLTSGQPGTICKQYNDVTKAETCSGSTTYLYNSHPSKQSENYVKISEVNAAITKALQGCPGITFHLPSYHQTTDYIRYLMPVPSMKEATLCAWIEADWSHSGDVKSIVSYLTGSGNYDEYSLNLVSRNKEPFRVYFNNRKANYEFPPTHVGKKLHVCNWLSRLEKQSGIYINAKSVDNASYNGNGIQGGGTFILGQEQDKPNSAFDSQQSLKGNITNLMMWPRVLTEREIANIVNNCSCPRDYSVVMTMDRVELHGDARYSVPEECPTMR